MQQHQRRRPGRVGDEASPTPTHTRSRTRCDPHKKSDSTNSAGAAPRPLRRYHRKALTWNSSLWRRGYRCCWATCTARLTTGSKRSLWRRRPPLPSTRPKRSQLLSRRVTASKHSPFGSLCSAIPPRIDAAV